LIRGPLALILVLSAILALWYFPFVTVSRRRWELRIGRTTLYLLIGWGLWVALLYLHPTAMVLMGTFCPLVFLRLPLRRAILAAAALTVSLYLFYALFYRPGESAPLVFALAGLLLTGAILLGIFISALIDQSRARQALADELRQAQADLLRVEREAGTLAERQRLAREIHDTLAQDFTSVIMHLSAAELHAGQDASAARDQVRQALRTARQGLDEARRIVWALRPEALERSSLAESIEQLAARWSAESGVPARTAVTGAPRPVRPEIEAAVLRAAQEALHNVRKHARARRVDLTLSYMSDLIALDVADDGVGFEPSAAPPEVQGGYGLKAMRERVEALGGALSVESGPGKGTALAVSLPLTEDS
jgi:signal transduction histidine kinase